eukprot:4373766-Alexandrium_andersonii.AAC.1
MRPQAPARSARATTAPPPHMSIISRAALHSPSALASSPKALAALALVHFAWFAAVAALVMESSAAWRSALR